jgi:DNA-binding NarL/FixJ family response regulator
MTHLRGGLIEVLTSDKNDHSNGATVVLADETQDRVGIRHALEHDGFSVVAEATTADEALSAARRYAPRVCLLDVDVPGGGIAAAGRITTELPDTKIAVFSGSGRQADVYAAIRAGADGYLLSGTPPERLSLAVAALLHGEVALPRALTPLLVAEVRRSGYVAPTRHKLAWRLLYLPRFVRHFRNRRGGGMSLGLAWQSARTRMVDYE